MMTAEMDVLLDIVDGLSLTGWEQPATATEKADLAEDVQVPKAVSPNRDSSDKAVQMLW